MRVGIHHRLATSEVHYFQKTSNWFSLVNSHIHTYIHILTHMQTLIKDLGPWDPKKLVKFQIHSTSRCLDAVDSLLIAPRSKN